MNTLTESDLDKIAYSWDEEDKKTPLRKTIDKSLDVGKAIVGGGVAATVGLKNMTVGDPQVRNIEYIDPKKPSELVPFKDYEHKD